MNEAKREWATVFEYTMSNGEHGYELYIENILVRQYPNASGLGAISAKAEKINRALSAVAVPREVAGKLAKALWRFAPVCTEPCDIGEGCMLCQAREALAAWEAFAGKEGRP